MKLAFQIIVIIFLILIGIFIIFTSPSHKEKEKLNIKIDDKNRLCFYVDSSYPIKKYEYTTLVISNKNSSETMWSFPTNPIDEPNSELNFDLSSFYGEENCISYGDNKAIQGLKNAKALNYEIVYNGIMSAEFDSHTHSYFEVYFKLHKNQSTGKMEVEIVDN